VRGFLIRLGVFGSLIIGLGCLVQGDMRALVAYSSVVHISPVLIGLISGSWLGTLGTFYIMVGHGLCSTCLFFILNLFYGRVKRRRILIIGGVVVYSPLLSVFWFSICIGNIGCPPTLNFAAELLLSISIINQG